MSALGQKQTRRHQSSYSKSGYSRALPQCPLSAISRHPANVRYCLSCTWRGGFSGPIRTVSWTFVPLSRRKWLKTNRRIADDRLQLSLLRSICSTSKGMVVCSWSAISCKPCQNSFSSETLVLCPLMVMERLMTADFLMCSSLSIKCSSSTESPAAICFFTFFGH